PPPPYSLGQVGAVQPLSAMRSSQSFCSGFLNVALRPPQIELSSSSVTATAVPRIEGGQFASSQARVSSRNVSRSLMVLTDPGSFPGARPGSFRCPSRHGEGPVPCNCSGVEGERNASHTAHSKDRRYHGPTPQVHDAAAITTQSVAEHGRREALRHDDQAERLVVLQPGLRRGLY